MSLSEDLRNELAAIAPARACCRLAELSALFHSAGALHLQGRGEVAVHLDLSSSAAARRAFVLLRDSGVASEIRTYRRTSFDRATRYQLHVSGNAGALGLLREAGVLGPRLAPLERPPKRVVGRACCRGAYLRGALLGGGSLSARHLEARTSGLDGARFLADVVAADGVALRVQERAGHAAAYAKGVDAIAEAVALAGASDTALVFEEQAVVGATRAQANRLANADHANLVRTSRAAAAQLRAIRALELDDLPEWLHEIAVLRLKNPTLSLRELAAKCDPPATKAAVQRRLRRLVELADL